MYWTKEKDERLRAAIIIYKKTQDRYIADKIIKTITPIVEGKLNTIYRRYFNLPPKEDIQQEVLLQCYCSLNNFNPCYRNGSGQLVKVYSYVTKIIQNTVSILLKAHIKKNKQSVSSQKESISYQSEDFETEVLDNIIAFIRLNHPAYLKIATDLKRHVKQNGKLFIKEFRRDYEYGKVYNFFLILRKNKSLFY